MSATSIFSAPTAGSALLGSDQSPLQLRITWAPLEAPLLLEVLELGDVPLTEQVMLRGGAAEFTLPDQGPLSRPRLRWQLVSAGAPVDETRVEVRDCSGRWHLLGALLGCDEQRRGWTTERTVPRFLLARG